MPSLAIEAANSAVLENLPMALSMKTAGPTSEESLATISKNIHKSFSFV